MSDRDNRIVQGLFRLAQDLPAVRSSRLAACVVYKNDVIGFGFSQKKSHPFQAKYAKNPDAIFLHAETDAIKNALRRISVDELSKSTLYVVRAKKNFVTKKWMFGMAKPCPGCYSAIVTYDIQNVVYTLEGDDYKYM